MRKKIVKLFVMAGLLLSVLFLLSVSAMAEDPISRSIEITPKALTGTGSVRVSINIINMGDDGGTISITLMDPDGNVCTGFGSGGTANLVPGASASYSGNWTVTQKQLEDGKVTYTARYSLTDENGVRVQVTRPIAASITHNQAKALLNIERFVEPGAKVVQGQTVKIRYVIKNVGTIDVQNITIKDPDITSEPAVRATLAVDDTAELSYSFVAGSTSKTTHAEISYQYTIGDKTETSKTTKADPPITIDVTIPDLIIQLTGTQIVNAGQKVNLTYVITNKSELSYEQIKIEDKLLGDIDSNLSIGAGKSHTGTKEITVNNTGTYQFTLTGVDSAGNNVIYQSNELTIQTTDTEVDPMTIGVVPVVLDIAIEADRDVIYQTPSEVVFRVKITNNGADAAENVIIGAATNISGVSKKIKEIDRIEPNETQDFLIRLNAEMGGQYMFTATAKDNTGKDTISNSNVFTVAFHATAPPVTPTPVPTEQPTEAPLPETVGETPPPFSAPEETKPGFGSILLYVLAGLLGVIIVAVGVLFFMDHRRGGGGGSGGSPSGGGGRGQIKVIDTIQRTPHRDYSRPPKRGSNTTAAPARQTPSRTAEPGPKSTAAPAEELPVFTDAYDVPVEAIPVRQEPVSAPVVVPAVEEEKPEIAEPKVEADTSSIYQRPRSNAVVEMPQRAAEEASEDDSASGDTSVYSRDYLSRIRQGSALQPVESPVEESAEPKQTPEKTQMSDEDAALLSGSTGQYRLTRNKANTPVRSRERASAPKAMDPEEFARKQRAAKSRGADLSSLYDDDEEEKPGRTTGRIR